MERHLRLLAVVVAKYINSSHGIDISFEALSCPNRIVSSFYRYNPVPRLSVLN